MKRDRSRRLRLPNRAKLVAWLAVGAATVGSSAPACAGHVTYQQIADTYAGQLVANGQAVGVGVAIIDGNGPPRFFTYGNAVQGYVAVPSKPFKPGSLFWIGSVSKVFTTNLLGQRVYTGVMRLDQPLSDYATQIGPMSPLTSRMTLKQLASFTGGLRDTPPVCPLPPKPPGCQPASTPGLQECPVWKFAKYIQRTVPTNCTVTPPEPVKKLPAPWFYSNYSAALTGLLIGGDPNERLGNRAVNGWFRAVRKEILKPLGMDNTFLYVPSDKSHREAAGYNQALGAADLVNGAISQVRVLSPGGGFSEAPNVEIVGGGGKGAKIVATIGPEHHVTGFTVANGGSGYVTPPVISFRNGGGTKPPEADAIIAGGKVIGIKVLSGGEGIRWIPDVVIEGGRKGGKPAKLEALVAGGELTYIRVTDPGSGYVDKLAVAVAPGDRTSFPVSVMAPAGFLVSSLRDMAVFARAALVEKHQFGIRKSLIEEGFRIAQRPYACTVGSPSLQTCPDRATRSGLGAWMIRPGAPDVGWPDIISKDGGIPGYSTFLTMMPEHRIAVVVFVNSRPDPDPGAPPATPIGQNILNTVYYECRKDGFDHSGCQ